MKAPDSFLWHDYETFGAEPMYDRPSQFAALRTDQDFNPLGEPQILYCAPADDVLPHPVACLITGITPQLAASNGLKETDFAAHIHAEMMQPGTCAVGYNSIRFDDVFTRNLFYRNLREPYEREWRNGNSRWDLIDLARMCYALRPDGIEWPMRESAAGAPVPSFRLEDLTRVNGIRHEAAHDAMSDVYATIGLAKLLRDKQPRLFEWALGLRDQKAVMNLLDPVAGKPVLHTSSRIPASRGCTTLVLPLAILPGRVKSVICFDLMGDPAPLVNESAEAIADRVFTPAADMPEGFERLPLKLIHTNHVPMVAPAATLRDADTGRIGLDPARCRAHAEQILQALPFIRPKVIEAFGRSGAEDAAPGGADPDQMLYSGFFSAHDRFLMNKILSVPASELGGHVWSFQDPRLPVMLFRYRARNYPETLSIAERETWEKDRVRRLITPADDRQFGYAAFTAAVAESRQAHREDIRAQRILDQLEAWVQETGLERLWRQHSEQH